MLKTGKLLRINLGLLTLMLFTASALATTQRPFIVLEASPDGPRIKHSDAQGSLQTLYRLKRGSQLFQFSHAQNRNEMLLAYAPARSGQQGIWRLEYQLKTGENAAVRLTPLLTDKDPDSWFFDPLYQPKSNQFYYISAQMDSAGQRASKALALRRYDMVSGESTLVSEQASHPAVSESGQYLIWQQQTREETQLAILTQGHTSPSLVPLQKQSLKLHFPIVSEIQQALYFLSTEAPLFTALPGINHAWAHPGSQHRDYYLWQLPVNATAFKKATLLWQTQEVRAMAMSPDGNAIGIVNDQGVHIVDPKTEKVSTVLSGRHYWKFSWAQ
ncbi:TolB-like translocation protein [Planctobacterium marinum]|uniref:hypothetical protein n=1 Tax=Planctobacterium marinum TaxID=1631968 RepID=UPI001E5AEA0B|nr:hypothetical protein [Planctobacterium marinum]MCC2605891.1 hypothetical protein [Planctobacterium marinum]